MSATEYFKPSQLVDLIHQNTNSFGVFHPGHRAVRANGCFYAGTFTPTPQAKTLSRALHLQDDPFPVTSRFSFGSGNVDDAPNGVVAMATRFYQPDGTHTNLIGIRLPAFPVGTQRAEAVPFSLQDALQRRGGKYSVADKPFRTYVGTDGRLITGQNPGSARAVGEAVVAALQAR